MEKLSKKNCIEKEKININKSEKVKNKKTTNQVQIDAWKTIVKI